MRLSLSLFFFSFLLSPPILLLFQGPFFFSSKVLFWLVFCSSSCLSSRHTLPRGRGVLFSQKSFMPGWVPFAYAQNLPPAETNHSKILPNCEGLRFWQRRPFGTQFRPPRKRFLFPVDFQHLPRRKLRVLYLFCMYSPFFFPFLPLTNYYQYYPIKQHLL